MLRLRKMHLKRTPFFFNFSQWTHYTHACLIFKPKFNLIFFLKNSYLYIANNDMNHKLHAFIRNVENKEYWRRKGLFWIVHIRVSCVCLFSECGQSPKIFDPKQTVSLIHAGHNSSRGDFPWMAALYTVLEEGKWKHICGGTLISPYIVLTGNIVTVLLLLSIVESPLRTSTH